MKKFFIIAIIKAYFDAENRNDDKMAQFFYDIQAKLTKTMSISEQREIAEYFGKTKEFDLNANF